MAWGSKLEEAMVALWYSEFIIVVIVHSWNVIKYLPDKNTKLVYNIVESTIGKVGSQESTPILKSHLSSYTSAI